MSGRWLRLRRAAWLAVATHSVAGLAMLLVLRHGLETSPSLEARAHFIAEHGAQWTSAWLTWNAAALSILYFFVAFAAAHWPEHDTTTLALAIAVGTAAVACDLAAESILMGVVVDLARPTLDELSRAAPGAGSRFLLWQRSAVTLTGYVANGLYTLATLLVVWTTRRAHPPLAVAAGLVSVAAGIILSGAALAGSVAGMFWSNAVLLPGLLLWLAAVASHASRRARAGEAA